MPLDEVEIFAKCLLPHLECVTGSDQLQNLFEEEDLVISQLADAIRNAIKDRTELQLKDNPDEA